jgi:hypothetical protein
LDVCDEDASRRSRTHTASIIRTRGKPFRKTP